MLAACADFASLAQATRGSPSLRKRARNGEDGIQSVANEYKVGNPIVVRLNDGRIVEGKIRAVIEGTDGLHGTKSYFL
jgi:hypothetical protein